MGSITTLARLVSEFITNLPSKRLNLKLKTTLAYNSEILIKLGHHAGRLTSWMSTIDEKELLYEMTLSILSKKVMFKQSWLLVLTSGAAVHGVYAQLRGQNILLPIRD